MEVILSDMELLLVEVRSGSPYYYHAIYQTSKRSMKLNAGSYTVELVEVPEQGRTWVVRVYRRFLFLNIPVSSDWFLEEDQARRFAEEMAERLKNGTPIEAIKNRKPGWHLIRPAH